MYKEYINEYKKSISKYEKIIANTSESNKQCIWMIITVFLVPLLFSFLFKVTLLGIPNILPIISLCVSFFLSIKIYKVYKKGKQIIANATKKIASLEADIYTMEEYDRAPTNKVTKPIKHANNKSNKSHKQVKTNHK